MMQTPILNLPPRTQGQSQTRCLACVYWKYAKWLRRIDITLDGYMMTSPYSSTGCLKLRLLVGVIWVLHLEMEELWLTLPYWTSVLCWGTGVLSSAHGFDCPWTCKIDLFTGPLIHTPCVCPVLVHVVVCYCSTSQNLAELWSPDTYTCPLQL